MSETASLRRAVEDDGALTATFTVTVTPNGSWCVNGKVRRRASRAIADIAEALAWLEWQHEQRRRR
jgi:hypothetical protein